MDEVLVILNPWAGRGRAERWRTRIEAILREVEVPHRLVLTERPWHAVALAREGAAASHSVVVAAGGDGTVHEVANGLIGSESQLGVIPLGNGNDFAKLLGLGRQPEQAVRGLARWRSRRFDVGRMGGRYFINGLGIGFDAAVVKELQKIRWLRGDLLYIAAVIKAFFRFRPAAMTIEFEGRRIEETTQLLEVSIGVSAGGGFYLTPDALPDDGLFDCCLIRRLNVGEFFRHLPKALRGTHTTIEPVTMFQTRRVHVSSPSPMACHVDGEFLIPPDPHDMEILLIPAGIAVCEPEAVGNP